MTGSIRSLSVEVGELHAGQDHEVIGCSVDDPEEEQTATEDLFQTRESLHSRIFQCSRPIFICPERLVWRTNQGLCLGWSKKNTRLTVT
jgi:hypothetical protein